MRFLIAIDLEDKYQGDADLLEACIRDGVSAFNQHVGRGAKVAAVRRVGDVGPLRAKRRPAGRVRPSPRMRLP